MRNTDIIGPCLGSASGSVAPGDQIIAGGQYATVERVVIHGPGQHPAGCPIVSTMFAVEAITANGSRWAGGTTASIHGDLRAHWDR